MTSEASRDQLSAKRRSASETPKEEVFASFIAVLAIRWQKTMRVELSMSSQFSAVNELGMAVSISSAGGKMSDTDKQ